MRILIVDDEKSLRLSLADELMDAGYEVETASSGEKAIMLLTKSEFDLVICDLIMKGKSGLDVLAYLTEHNLKTEFLLITAHATVESAVEILKKGAIDYICKPFEIDRLLRVIYNVGETIRLKRENEALRTQLYERYQFHNFIGKSASMQKVFDTLSIVSNTEATVLITGETGTGKGLVAEAIHYNSARRDKPFISVSCAALSRDLLESELFGHEAGAFTGAIKQKKGRFELAHEGTLFLDEIDDMPLETQVKLLRSIETNQIERVGGEETLQLDVRIIAATKSDLLKLVETNTFRNDLYFRLNVIQINLPPLRDHKEDIPLLVDHFLEMFSPETPFKVSSEIMEILLHYDWRGNVRELKHAIERLVLLGSGGSIDKSALPTSILNHTTGASRFEWGKSSLPDYCHQQERQILVEALQRADGSKTRMAELLGVPLPTLKSKLKKFQLS